MSREIEQTSRTPRKSASEALSRLEHLPQPPAHGAIERAWRIVRLIEEYKSPAPFVFPTEIGGVQFEWHGTPHELDIEIFPEGDRVAFLTLSQGLRVNEGEISEDAEMRIVNLLNWIVWSR